ncbi:hypothetical protein SISSUDRAFT_1036962 [Sistotremastrum suecicum HHB10207 ss-3]|uniref:Uncharacterized protein n=1 Tax=Sistotremastrum suecicum HHB10207 ss-3 TaxID=1314776 RepID=A0A165YSL5_9AGAM|nr:hypothetical protein SISSUDRAFT_1036962 [Sistotremastrum suecicum HHB10207 ss-3]
MFTTLPPRTKPYALNFYGTIHDWQRKDIAGWQPLPTIVFEARNARGGIILADHANPANPARLVNPDDVPQLVDVAYPEHNPLIVHGWPGVRGPFYQLRKDTPSRKHLASQIYDATRKIFNSKDLGRPYSDGVILCPIKNTDQGILLRFDDLVLHGLVNVGPCLWQPEFSVLSEPNALVSLSLA